MGGQDQLISCSQDQVGILPVKQVEIFVCLVLVFGGFRCFYFFQKLAK